MPRAVNNIFGEIIYTKNIYFGVEYEFMDGAYVLDIRIPSADNAWQAFGRTNALLILRAHCSKGKLILLIFIKK